MTNAALIFLVAAFCVSYISAADVTKAQAIIYKDGDKSQKAGTVTFEKIDDTHIKVTAVISGLSPGQHGFHVHEKGDLGGKCTDAGGHFNPYNMSHGAPTDTVRHVGDLGNMNVSSDTDARFEMTDTVITFSGNTSIIGKGFVIHAGVDDLGKGGQSDSLTTGHAGARWGCGIIEENGSNGQWLSFGSLIFAVIFTVMSR